MSQSTKICDIDLTLVTQDYSFLWTRYLNGIVCFEKAKIILFDTLCLKKLTNLKTIHELTPKQRKFVDVLVGNWGLMSKTQAAKEAGYNSTTKNGLSEMASKLTNINKNPHVVRYLEKKIS
jgi:hypothetical protein